LSRSALEHREDYAYFQSASVFSTFSASGVCPRAFSLGQHGDADAITEHSRLVSVPATPQGDRDSSVDRGGAFSAATRMSSWYSPGPRSSRRVDCVAFSGPTILANSSPASNLRIGGCPWRATLRPTTRLRWRRPFFASLRILDVFAPVSLPTVGLGQLELRITCGRLPNWFVRSKIPALSISFSE